MDLIADNARYMHTELEDNATVIEHILYDDSLHLPEDDATALADLLYKLKEAAETALDLYHKRMAR